VKSLITYRITDYFCCNFYDKIKSSKDFLKKVLFTKKYDLGECGKLQMLEHCLFLSKMHHLNFCWCLNYRNSK